MKEQNFYKNILENEQTKEELNRFTERFRVKLFYEKYRNLARLCNTFSWGFNGLSVASGVLGVASLLAMFVLPNLWVMVIPAIILLGLVEFAKRVLLSNWVIEKLRDKTVNKTLILANVLLVALSMAATVYGGIELVNIARGKAKPTLTSIQLIETKYKAEITKIEALQTAIIARNTYKGKTYLPKDERVLNTQYDNDIRRLKADQKKEVAKAQKTNDQKLAAYRGGTQQYIVGFVLLSLVIEGLCIIAIVFPIYYQYKSLDDKEKLTRAFNLPELSIDALYGLMHKSGLPVQNLVQQFTQQLSTNIAPPISPQTTLASNENRPIVKGFAQQNKSASKSDNKPDKQPIKRKRGKVVDYERVYALIDKGGLTSAEIATLCKCSESTVRTAKRERKQGHKLTNGKQQIT